MPCQNKNEIDHESEEGVNNEFMINTFLSRPKNQDPNPEVTSECYNKTILEKIGGEKMLEELIKHWMEKSKFLKAGLSKISDKDIRIEKYKQYIMSLLDKNFKYIGKDIAKAHADLGISDEMFDDSLNCLNNCF